MQWLIDNGIIKTSWDNKKDDGDDKKRHNQGNTIIYTHNQAPTWLLRA